MFELSTIDTSGNVEKFRVTDDHPWRVDGKGWVQTVSLNTADRLVTANSTLLTVVAIVQTSDVEQTYNLTVDEWHTFLVGKNRIVVHNADCKRALRELRTNKEFKDFFHKYKHKYGLGRGEKGVRNRDLDEEEIANIFDEWVSSGKPRNP